MMSQTASLFQYYQKWVFEEEKLSEHSENSQNTLIKANSSTNFILFNFLLPFEQNKIVAVVSVTHFQNMLIWNKWLLHQKLKELLHPILVSQGNWFRRDYNFYQYTCGETNDLYIMQKLVTIKFSDFLRN